MSCTFYISEIGRKDSFIGPQEFVVGYSKAPGQPQSSARPICHCHTMTSTSQPPYALLHIGSRGAKHCATGDEVIVLTPLSHSTSLHTDVFFINQLFENKFLSLQRIFSSFSQFLKISSTN